MKNTKVVYLRLPISDLGLIDRHILPDNPNLSDFVRLAVREKLQRDLHLSKNKVA